MDPFFDLTDDPEWNACIGRQATEENYVDGYLEAALELATAVIDKGLLGQRDTLAMPILYNARHGLELALKLAINRLHSMGAITERHPQNHDIGSHWKHIDKAGVGDVAVRGLVAELRPYVDSLARIDDDGQALRFPENQAGEKSLEDKALANIAVIRGSVVDLCKILERLKYRVMDLALERETGTYTPELSRSDLIAIADRLPTIGRWREAAFDDAKAAVMADFGLSGKRFSAAIEVIKSSRETCRRIGQLTPLKHLSDEHAVFTVEQWASCHPPRKTNALGFDFAGPRDFEAIATRRGSENAAIDAIIGTLDLDEIADLEAVYLIGRAGDFAEHYDAILTLASERRHLEGDDLRAAVRYLVSKTNLKAAVMRGLGILGRPDLAAQVEAINQSPTKEGGA